MSEKKTKTVHLMVEARVNVPVDQDDAPDDEEIVDEVKELLLVCIANSSDSPGERGRSFVFRWGENPIVMNKPRVLPDDIKEILAKHSGKHLSLRERLRNAVIEEGKKPSKEQWQALIDRGAINENGEVLLRGPGCNEDETD